MRRRSGTSTAASGSSSSSSDGPDISARPSATRWRSPPDRSVTRRSSSAVDLQHADDAIEIGRHAGMAAVEQVAAHEHVRKQRDVLRHVPDVTVVRRQVDARRRTRTGRARRRRSSRAAACAGRRSRRGSSSCRRPDGPKSAAARASSWTVAVEHERRPARARCRDRSRRASARRAGSPSTARRTRSRPTPAAARAPARPGPFPRSRRSPTASVRVAPGMLPATMIVAPNSPSARANASTAPASTDGHASGRLIVRKTRAGDAPSVAATRSYRALTCSNPARAVRTRSGSPMIAIASTTAFHVNTISMPSRSSTRPTLPRRPRSMSRMQPRRDRRHHQRQRHERLDQRRARETCAAPAARRARRRAGG